MSESSSSSSDSREQLPLSNQEQEVGLESSQVPLILPIDEPAENRAVEPVQKVRSTIPPAVTIARKKFQNNLIYYL
jgi:hypothetical protein